MYTKLHLVCFFYLSLLSSCSQTSPHHHRLARIASHQRNSISANAPAASDASIGVNSNITINGSGGGSLTSDFGDGGLPAGAPPVPTNIAPSTTYDLELAPFPVAYSDAEKDAQTQAGTDLSNTLNSVFQQHLNTSNIGNGTGSYTVKPGVYRISQVITIPNVANFKLIMSDVELITTSTNQHFQINDADNLEIAGPLYLDADPIAESQGVIVGTDGTSYVDVQGMPGYPIPNLGSRLKCFTKDGIMQRHYQDSIATVDDRGNNTYRVTTQAGAPTFVDFPCLSQVGNYFTSQSNKTTYSGGVNFQGTGNLYAHEIYHYYSGLTFGQNVQGTLRFDRWMVSRISIRRISRITNAWRKDRCTYGTL